MHCTDLMRIISYHFWENSFFVFLSFLVCLRFYEKFMNSVFRDTDLKLREFSEKNNYKMSIITERKMRQKI